VLHTEGGEITQPNFKGKIESVGLFIGPEGGFTDEEITQAQEYNYHIHTFPNMILRGETAAIVGTFWVKGLVGNN
jgi:16S rRNA (uracil1498-N3)-methyltransferase